MPPDDDDHDLFQIARCPHGSLVLRFGPACIHLSEDGFRRVTAAANRVLAVLDQEADRACPEAPFGDAVH